MKWAMYCAVLWAVGGLGWARMRLRRIHRPHPHRPRSERNSAVPKLTAQGQSPETCNRCSSHEDGIGLLATMSVRYEVFTRICGRLAM